MLKKDCIKKDLGVLKDNFLNFKKFILRNLVIAIFFFLLSFFLVGSRFLYPYHFSIAVFSLGLSGFFLFLTVRTFFRSFSKFYSYDFARNYLKKERKILIMGFCIMIFGSVFLLIRPFGETPFKDYSSLELDLLVQKDLEASVLLIDKIEINSFELLSLLSQDDLSVLELEKVRDKWGEFLVLVREIELLTEKYKYFHQLPKSAEKRLRAKGFMISYGLYVKKNELVQRVIVATHGKDSLQKILNERIDLINRDTNFNFLGSYFYSPKTRLRLSLGRAYMKFKYDSLPKSGSAFYEILQIEAQKSYAYLLANFHKSLESSFSFGLVVSEQKMFDQWFPVQKTVANSLTNVVVSERGALKFITGDLIADLKSLMEPGDIMLQRRNWHLTNIGIPGFWTHSALYTGDLDMMNSYFSSEFPRENFNDFKSLLKDRYPLVYANYLESDERGRYSVIEGIAAGIVLQSLETSAYADSLGVLRPNLSKEDKLQAILRSYANYHKPYDYNFDFETKDAFVCSELIYDAFLSLKNKDGLYFNLNLLHGRPLVSPMNIFEKFVAEKDLFNSELQFVAYIKGDELSQSAEVSTLEAFVETLYYSKFSFRN